MEIKQLNCHFLCCCGEKLQLCQNNRISSDHYRKPLPHKYSVEAAAHIFGLLRPAWAHLKITVQNTFLKRILCERPVSQTNRTHGNIYIWRLSHCNTGTQQGTTTNVKSALGGNRNVVSKSNVAVCLSPSALMIYLLYIIQRCRATDFLKTQIKEVALAFLTSTAVF